MSQYMIQAGGHIIRQVGCTCAGSLWRYKSLLNSSTATSAPRSNWKQEFIEPYWRGDRAVLYHPTPHNKCHKHDNLTTEILWGWEASGISWSVAFSIIHLELAYTSLRFKKQLTISCESMYNCTYMQVRQCYSQKARSSVQTQTTQEGRRWQQHQSCFWQLAGRESRKDQRRDIVLLTLNRMAATASPVLLADALATTPWPTGFSSIG